MVFMEFYGNSPEHDLTYSDVFLLPSHSRVTSRFDVSLSPGDGSGMQIPIVSANMTSVTGKRLAATLARRGGLGVLPQDMALQELHDAIAWVKAQPVRWDTPYYAYPNESVSDVLRRVPAAKGLGVVIREGNEAGTFLGALATTQLAVALPDARVGDLLRGAMTALDAEDLDDGQAVFEAMNAAGLEFAPVIEHGRLRGTVSIASALRSTLYKPACDAEGRLRVAVALGINGDVVAKARALVASGVDVLVLDTAHGDQEAMLRAVRAVADLSLGVPLVAGNVVTGRAVEELVRAGADIIKVGVGPGAMCTTRMMTAVGRPQFSAVAETSAAAQECHAHVWADGGVRYPRDVALALAAGGASVMIGSWFAGTIESPGLLCRDERGALYKESWGMASTKAVNARFGRLDAFERARKELFAEGISNSRIYVDPERPSVEDLVDMITAGLRSSLTYTGAENLTEFRKKARVGLQSAAGYEEGRPLPSGW